jgi:DNA adenine methylase
MKTPITYYGGKQNLISEILPMIPKHTQYVEPFCGGASVFWSKRKSEHEVINDTNQAVFNFWYVCKNDFENLKFKIDRTLHSEDEYLSAKEILNNEITDRTLYAWAFWTSITLRFSNKRNGGYGFSNDGRQSRNTTKKREGFESFIYERIKDVEIFNRDAIELILLKDSPETFMYFDPPYPDTHLAHYKNTEEVFFRLIEILPTLKCKWMLSSYPNESLLESREKYKWQTKDIQRGIGVSNNNAGKKKIETLTWNYTYEGMNMQMF